MPSMRNMRCNRCALLARSLNMDSTLRVSLAGAQAEAWRAALVAQGVRSARLTAEVNAEAGLVIVKNDDEGGDEASAKRYDRFMATHSGTDQPVNAEGLLHPIHIFNKNYYLYAREGDTFKSIGKEVGISWRKLARYNERNKHAVLHKGDIIYLKKKRSKAPKQYKKRPHVIQPGESMYTISQKYGIRLEKLYKMNHLDPNIPVSVGTRLRVR